MNKKIGMIVGSIAGGLAILGVGSLALFTARTDSDFSAKAGTVTIDLKELNMTNSKNVNPGDNDPDNPVGAAEGTEHKFTYEVYNTGNKSIRTRHTIILTIDEAGESDELLDARFLALFNKGKEIAKKSYILEDDAEVDSLDKINRKVKAVKYVFLSDIFDGKGNDVEKGGDAEKEKIADVVTQNTSGDVSKKYSYDFSLLRGADNKYQAADIHITVTVEGMQYRNTDENDWSQSAIVVRKYSTADVGISVVPASNEDKAGNIITETAAPKK